MPGPSNCRELRQDYSKYTERIAKGPGTAGDAGNCSKSRQDDLQKNFPGSASNCRELLLPNFQQQHFQQLFPCLTRVLPVYCRRVFSQPSQILHVVCPHPCCSIRMPVLNCMLVSGLVFGPLRLHGLAESLQPAGNRCSTARRPAYSFGVVGPPALLTSFPPPHSIWREIWLGDQTRQLWPRTRRVDYLRDVCVWVRACGSLLGRRARHDG